jgi:hypothetical protein
LAVWTLAFLSLLAFAMGGMTRREIDLVKRIEERARLYDGLYSGGMTAVNYIRTYALKDASPDVDSLNDGWSDAPDIFSSRRVGDAVFSVAYKSKDAISGKENTRYGLVDEERKININYAPKTVLERLFVIVGGLDPIRAEKASLAVIDWRDKDDIEGEQKSGSSESVAYNNLGKEYSPKNAAFSAPEEILMVSGIDEELFVKIREHITVFGNGTININTAPRAVLLSLGLSDQLVWKILTYRSGPDMAEGTDDDNVFMSAGEAVNCLSAFSELSGREKEELTRIMSTKVLGVLSTCMSAVCLGSTEKGGLKGELLCVFDKKGHVKYWGYRYTI